MHTIIGKEDYLEAGQVFTWASKEHYQVWFTGKTVRHRRTEQMLPRLVRKGKLVKKDYGKKLIYAVPRTKNTLIEHGLGCTEGLVRIWRSNMEAMIIAERHFKGLGSVPDWGMLFGERLLLFEYTTQNNFEQARIVKTKITKYQSNLEGILEKFGALEGVVLFVIDVARVRVENFVNRLHPDGPFMFCDYETFKSVPIGEQLTAPIYIWGEDGETYPLRHVGLQDV